MEATEHTRRLEALLNRLHPAADRIFDAAGRVQEILEAEEERLGGALGDAPRADRATSRRWRRLDQVQTYVDSVTRDVVRWQRCAYDIYAEQPGGRWGRWRQRRRLRSAVMYLESAANRLETLHP